MPRFIFDAHLDLAMNAQEWNRDLTQPLAAIRAREQGLADKPDRGQGTVCLPELRRGQVGLCVATQIARYVAPGNPLPGWHSPAQAWAQTQGQLAWYRAMEAQGQMVQISDWAGLQRHLARWQHPTPDLPIGYILSLEGADSIIDLSYVELAHAQGLRAIGPAHYGPGRYAHGTASAGGLGPQGRQLLREMERLGLILDATHLCDQSFWEAMDHFNGPVWASHHLCRRLVPGDRQLADDQIRELLGRGAVIGMALDAWMLVPGWVRGRSTPASTGLTLAHLVPHIDHICQLAGNAHHVGLGTDLDGAFGREQCPQDLDSIADLQKLDSLLRAHGYSEADIEGIFSQNFLRFLARAWGGEVE
jgi:membrane dipeptidase